ALRRERQRDRRRGVVRVGDQDVVVEEVAGRALRQVVGDRLRLLRERHVAARRRGERQQQREEELSNTHTYPQTTGSHRCTTKKRFGCAFRGGRRTGGEYRGRFSIRERGRNRIRPGVSVTRFQQSELIDWNSCSEQSDHHRAIRTGTWRRSA